MLALLFCLVVPPSAAAQHTGAIGKVVAMRGAAIVTQGQKTTVIVLGATVQAGDRIDTGANSKVEIRFDDGTRLTVGPGSRVALTDYAPGGPGGPNGGGHGLLDLLIGIVRTSLASVWEGGNFAVKTRTAVASARSTEWITEAKDGNSAVFVLSGTVAVAGTSGGRTVEVPAGFGTDVDAHGPSTPVQWGQIRADDARARTYVP